MRIKAHKTHSRAERLNSAESERVMLKKALKKLNICQEAYCETMSALIERFRAKGLKEEYERKCGKLRGYLECLSDMDVITTSEMINLYGYYFSEDRSKDVK